MIARVATTVAAPRVSAYTIPTDIPESDGTFAWESTTVVVVELDAGAETGIGWSYCSSAAGRLIDDVLAPLIEGSDVSRIGATHAAMKRALRNTGLPGLGAMALSAVDIALWDLRAKQLGVPVSMLVGGVNDAVPIYGSGGFCSYSDAQLTEQLGGWAEDGIPRVKMKVGRDPGRDVDRVAVAREAIGGETELYVDGNGAYAAKDALSYAERFAAFDVRWFEEPVSSDHVEELRLVREQAPAGMEVAAGEYASTLFDFRRLIGAVDCLQADATRCCGITGLLAAGALADAHGLDLSGHTAPSIHAHALCGIRRLRHLEWFHDHVRVERMLFDGFLEPEDGQVRPDPDRPGLGVELKRGDAERYAA